LVTIYFHFVEDSFLRCFVISDFGLHFVADYARLLRRCLSDLLCPEYIVETTKKEEDIKKTQK